MKLNYFTMTLVIIMFSCHNDSSDNSLINENSLLSETNQDSILQNYVSLSDIQYSLDITLEAAQSLGVTKHVYENVKMKSNRLREAVL